MSITLSSADLQGLRRATALLLSPLDHAEVDGWRSAVNHTLRELLHADSAGFFLPVPEGLMMYSEEHDPAELARYPELLPPPLHDGTPCFARAVELGVTTTAQAYGPDVDLFLRSAYYNEFAGPNQAHDSLVAALSPSVSGLPGAMLQFWHSSPRGRRFGDREEVLLHLLLPAFRAGVDMQLRWGNARADLLNTLDGLGRAALVYDLPRGVVHATPSLEALLRSDPDAAEVRGQMLAVAQEVGRCAGAHPGFGDAPPRAVVRDVATGSARYRVSGCLHGAAMGSAAAVAVVGLERLAGAPRTPEELYAEFALTPAEARVALLLAEGRSNAEIAAQLCFSPHTARRHTERILHKLNVRSRAEVAVRLLT